jgi:dihydrofolate reductase
MNSPRIVVLAAVAQNGCIGREGRMPWHLPPDLKHFKALTQQHRVVMGHTTFLGLGRALPNRENIVLTRQADCPAVQGVRYAADLLQALDFVSLPAGELATQTETIYVIGGAQIYTQALALPQVKHLHLTLLDQAFEGDTFFPKRDNSWRETQRISHQFEQTIFHYVDYVRDTPASH